MTSEKNSEINSCPLAGLGGEELRDAAAWAIDDTNTEHPPIAHPSQNLDFSHPDYTTFLNAPVITMPSPERFEKATLQVPTSGDETPVSGDSGAPSIKAVEDQERIREKNRRAQTKYREKLKAGREAKKEILNTLTDDVERLQLNNAQLGMKNSVLEIMLEDRETKQAILEEGKVEKNGEAHLPLLDVLYTPGLCEGGAPPGIDDQRCPLEGMTHVEVAAIRKKPPEAVKNQWLGLCQGVQAALDKYNNAALSQEESLVSEAEAELQATLWEAGCFTFETAVVKPNVAQRLLAASVNDKADGPEETANALRWQEVVIDMELTLEQMQTMASVRENFLERIADVKQRRRAALDAVDAGTQALSLSALQDRTIQWLHLHSVTQELQVNVQEEFVACMEMVVNAFGRLLTPVQKAKAILASYPNFPDLFALTTAAGKQSKADPRSIPIK